MGYFANVARFVQHWVRGHICEIVSTVNVVKTWPNVLIDNHQVIVVSANGDTCVHVQDSVTTKAQKLYKQFLMKGTAWWLGVEACDWGIIMAH